MGSQASFGRIAVLKVFNRQLGTSPAGVNTLINVDRNGTGFPSVFPNGQPGFRIKFKVDKVAAVTSATPNPITIYIYNLGAQSRALVSKTNNLLILEAGYANQPRQIFQGNILWGRTTKQGPLYVTEIQAADGLFAFQNSVIDTSFAAGVSNSQVVSTLVGSLQGAGIGAGQVMGVPSGGYNYGITLSGKTVDILKEVCDRNNLQFSIQDGNVLILPYGSDRGAPAPLISQNTGLIGIPEIRAADITGQATLLSFKCLMRPELGVFQKVVLQSKFVNGIYTTARVTHEGDTWEGDFLTHLECA